MEAPFCLDTILGLSEGLSPPVNQWSSLHMLSCGVSLKIACVIHLDSLESILLKKRIKVISPVLCGNDYCPILSTYELGMVHLSRLLHSCLLSSSPVGNDYVL